MTGEVRYPLTVYYDASCPMCAAEMHALRDADREGRLQLIDCSDEDCCAGDDVTREAMMERLHARDADGRWLVAMDAYEAVFGAVGYARASRLAGAPALRPLLDRIYRSVARNRSTLSRLGVGRMARWLLRG